MQIFLCALNYGFFPPLSPFFSEGNNLKVHISV
jgi:hypothetical protein